MGELKLYATNREEVVVSSRDIARALGKRHKNVLRDIRTLNDETEGRLGVAQLWADPQNGQEYEQYTLNESQTMLLLMTYNNANLLDIKCAYIDEFNNMRQALHDIRFNKNDKQLQLNAMELLQGMLPDDLKSEKLPYIKANQVANKATSNYFGFPKALKKCDMNQDMLELRQCVIDDYMKLYDILEPNDVKELVYKKYRQPLLTN